MKKIVIFMSTMIYFLPMYGMEIADPDPSRSNKSPQLSRQNSKEIIIPPAREGSRAGRNVPPLDLQEVVVHAPTDPVKVDGSSKQRVKSLKDLGRCVSQKPGITSRAVAGHASSSGTHTHPATRGARLDMVIVDDASNVGAGGKIPLASDTHPIVLSVEALAKEGLQKAPSLLPKIFAQQSAQPNVFDDKKSGDEEYMWNFLKAVNPALYDFSLKHNLSLEEVEEYAILIDELDIDPSVINEYVHQNNSAKANISLLNQGLNYVWGDLRKQNMENLAKKYEQIKKENPETYKQMILEVMKAAADLESGGQHGRSTIADTHVGLQSDKIDDQAGQLRLAYISLIIGSLLTMGGWAFGVVGQFINPTNSTS